MFSKGFMLDLLMVLIYASIEQELDKVHMELMKFVTQQDQVVMVDLTWSSWMDCV